CVCAAPHVRTARNAEEVLLANERVLIDVACAAVVLGVARRRGELADSAIRAARISVVAAADGIGRVGFIAMNAAIATWHIRRSAAVLVFAVRLARGAASARRLA